MKSTVSIIVPIYNVEQYIDKCLNSIKNQTYDSLQVILVDDGSTDDSGSIAEKFAKTDNRFFYFKKENGGLSSARNYGLGLASGEFIYFLDSDDWIEKSYISDLISAFEKEVEVVIANYTLEDQSVNKIYIPCVCGTANRIFEGNEKEREIFCRHLNSYPKSGYSVRYTIMPVWKNMYKNSLLQRTNLKFVSEREVGAEDYVFNCIAYYYAKQVKTIDATGYHHLVVANSLSRRIYHNELERISKKYDYVKNFLKKCELNNRVLCEEALDDDMVKAVVFAINNSVKNKVKRSEFITLVNSPETKFLQNKKKINIERKYLLIRFILLHLNNNIAFVTLLLLNKPYHLYRQCLALKKGKTIK